jgi:hypothetical protein
MGMSLDYIREANRPPRPQVYYEPPVLDMTDLRYYKENFPEAEPLDDSPELTEEEFIAALQDSYDERMRALTKDPVNWSKDGF